MTTMTKPPANTGGRTQDEDTTARAFVNSTATSLLMAVLTSNTAKDVLDLDADLLAGDWPTAQHHHIWQAVVAQAQQLANYGHGNTVVSAELVYTELRRNGQLDFHVQGLLSDALGTVRGGHRLPPTAAAEYAHALKRQRLATVCAIARDMFDSAASGSDRDVRRAIAYVENLRSKAARAGVNLDEPYFT
mgnify:FL=1